MPVAFAQSGTTELVSVASDGTQGNDISGRFSPPAVSADGLVVAFDSVATNLVAGDAGANDIFVRDRSSGTTQRVSVDSNGNQANNGSFFPAISGDGRLVVFQSLATNLVPGDTNNRQDIFVHDRLTGVTTRVSVDSAGAQANGDSRNAVISDNGRFVAFGSDASNLTSQGAPGIFVHDLLTGSTELVSVNNDGVPANGFTVAAGDISGDGRFVTFHSAATNLVRRDKNGTFDVFVRDRAAGTTVRASVNSRGREVIGSSVDPSISDDGRFVAFASDATNLVPGDTNGVNDAFVHDLLTGATERVSVDSAGNQGNGQSVGPGIRGGAKFGPKISGDGRFVAFDSIATNLVPDDTNTCQSQIYSFPVSGQCPDVFVRDRQTGTTSRVSVSSGGAQSNGPSTDPAINADGSVVAFFSAATNLVPGDLNTCGFFTVPGQCPDIFVRVR